MRLEEAADGLVVILQCKYHGADLLQKLLHARKFDRQAPGGEVDAGGQAAEAGAEELDSVVLSRDPDMAGAGDRQ